MGDEDVKGTGQPQKTPQDIEREKQAAKLQQELQMEKDRLAAQNTKEAIEDKEYRRAKARRQQDMAEGRKRGEELFGDKSLGRIGSLEKNRDQEIQNLIAERKARSQGYTPEEINAMRSQNLSQLQQAGQGQERQLRMQQAQMGVRGPAALAQQAKLAQAQGSQQADLERQLFLGNIERRDQGLNSLEETIGKARQEALAKQQFNIGQTQREKFGQLATEMGFGGLGAGERAAVMQKLVGEQQAKAGIEAANAGGGKK